MEGSIVKQVLMFLVLTGWFAMAASSLSAGPAKLVREDERTYLAGVEKLGWDMGRSVTFIGALTAAAHAMGAPFTFDYLMGASGVAFKLHKWGKGWCPSAGCAGPGYDVISRAFDATGYRTKGWLWFDNKPSDAERVEAIRLVTKSIDRGWPALYEVEDAGLCVGYTKGCEKFITRTYFDKEGEYTETGRWPWILSVIVAREEPLGRKEAVVRSLKSAIEQAETPEFNGYWSGWKAYEDWRQGLLDETPPANEEEARGKQHANAFVYMTFTDSRNAAHQYLKQVRNELGPESAPHLDSASEYYEHLYKVLKKGAHFAPACLQASDLKNWNAEMRKREAKVLEDAEALDRKAIAELKLALASAR